MKKINFRLDQSYKLALNNLKWYSSKSKKKIHFLPGLMNRSVNTKHVDVINESVKKLSVVRPAIVVEVAFFTGKPELYVADGQHMFRALERLGFDIPYITIKIATQQELIETIAMLNNSSKSWILTNYIGAWSYLKDDYKELNSYIGKYSDVEASIIGAVFSGNTVASGAHVTKLIKTGNFVIKNKQRAIVLMEYLKDALNVVMKMSRYENRYFCSEYIKYVKEEGTDYNHKTFIEKLRRNKDCISLAINAKGRLVEKFKTMK